MKSRFGFHVTVVVGIGGGILGGVAAADVKFNAAKIDPKAAVISRAWDENIVRHRKEFTRCEPLIGRGEAFFIRVTYVVREDGRPVAKSATDCDRYANPSACKCLLATFAKFRFPRGTSDGRQREGAVIWPWPLPVDMVERLRKAPPPARPDGGEKPNDPL